ncbi:unnamed protein product [Phytomonas sp. Hart1]|nr:unnamed protein product [Phytomonas sp. Hart1]|eukprot:CCW67784.1 unnamed protein product [Phytomonas sp. isolate Hart1]
MVVVEPHVDRDWLCRIRGFHSVREVVVLGPVDSPAMASFAYPLLSFGVLPGPATYELYNAAGQKLGRGAERARLPMDPPHEAQGYTRRFVDEVSAWMIAPNDFRGFTGQHRCLAFVRQTRPVLRARRSDPLVREAGETHKDSVGTTPGGEGMASTEEENTKLECEKESPPCGR